MNVMAALVIHLMEPADVPLDIWAKNVLKNALRENMVKIALSNANAKMLGHVTLKPENVRVPKDGLDLCKCCINLRVSF